MAISYRCDRCGVETAPDKLYEVEIMFTPRALDGSMNSDAQETRTLGDLCATCSDDIEERALGLVNPSYTKAVPAVSDQSGGS